MFSLTTPTHLPTILMAEDDEDDRLLVQRSLARLRINANLQTVNDGCALMDYLHRRGEYADARLWPWPSLVLLDLNMPRMDGRQALAEIKGDQALRRVPVVILTTSNSEEDIIRSYDLHANSYIQKPSSVKRMSEILGGIYLYWFQLVEPTPRAATHS